MTPSICCPPLALLCPAVICYTRRDPHDPHDTGTRACARRTTQAHNARTLTQNAPPTATTGEEGTVDKFIAYDEATKTCTVRWKDSYVSIADIGSAVWQKQSWAKGDIPNNLPDKPENFEGTC